MRKLLFVFILVSSFLRGSCYASNVDDQLAKIRPLFSQNLDSAYLLSKELLEESTNSGDLYGIVKSNLYLGYTLYLKEDHGKSVIYFLEGIRQAENADYDNVEIDLIWLNRNLGNTFMQFQANGLATKYNNEGIRLATKLDIESQIVDIKYNQGLVYQNNKQYDEASQILTDILPFLDSDPAYKSEILNQIGLVHLENGDHVQAAEYFNEVIENPNSSELFRAKALHNLGEIHYAEGEHSGAIEKLYEAIDLMHSIEDVEKYGLFISYRNIGQYLFKAGQIEDALFYLNKGEEIIDFADWDPSSFNLYKTYSDLYYHLGMNELGQEYSEKYFDKVQVYLETQGEIQSKDKEYNFELIAKRYFDNVEKQERIASIMFFTKLSSGSLLAILALVIIYYQMGKVRLRRSIESELRSLKVLD